MKKFRDKMSALFQEWSLWIAAMMALISSNLFCNFIWEYLSRGSVDSPLSMIGLFIAFIYVGLTFALFYERKQFLRQPRLRRFVDKEIAEKREHLVLHLSRSEVREKGLQLTDFLKDGFSDDIESDLERMDRIKKEKKPQMWNWEMAIRAIAHQLRGDESKLKTVTIICSKESLSQVHDFLFYCGGYSKTRKFQFCILAKRIEGKNHNGGQVELIEVPPPESESFGEEYRDRLAKMFGDQYLGFDFGSVMDLSNGIEFFLKKAAARKYQEKEIMIDITGGKKPTSIVSAIWTYNRKVQIQYVEPVINTDRFNVVSYDLVSDGLDTDGLSI